MKRSDLLELEKTMMKEVVKRRQLGGYSADAEGILVVCETLMRLLQYVIDDVVPQDMAANDASLKPKRKSK